MFDVFFVRQTYERLNLRLEMILDQRGRSVFCLKFDFASARTGKTMGKQPKPKETYRSLGKAQVCEKRSGGFLTEPTARLPWSDRLAIMFPTRSGGKLILRGNAICQDLVTRLSWILSHQSPATDDKRQDIPFFS